MKTPEYDAKVHAYGTFQVNEFITAKDFKMVDFNKNDLDSAYSENTSVISYIGHMLGRARRQTANFKTRRDAVKAQVARKLRDAAGPKGLSEARVESEMRGARELIEVSMAENHAIEVETTIEALYWAARGRRNDMEFFAEKQRAEISAKNYTTGRGKGAD